MTKMLKHIFFQLAILLITVANSQGQFYSQTKSNQFTSSRLIKSDKNLNFGREYIDLLMYKIKPESSKVDSTRFGWSYRTLKIGKQIVFSQTYGGLLALGFTLVGAVAAPKIGFGGIYIMYVGYLTGMMVGVHSFGNDDYEEAAFSETFVGGLIGFSIGYVIYQSDPKPHGFTAIAPLALPTLGAIISFNLSAKPTSKVQ